MAETSNNMMTVQSRYHHKTLTSRLWNFFTTKYQVDCVLTASSKGMVSAHQLILDVFLPPEKVDSRNALSDPRSDLHLQSLLQFIYTGTVQVEAEELDDLLWLARELDFQMLVDAVKTTMADAGSNSAGGGNDSASYSTIRLKSNSVKIMTLRGKRTDTDLDAEDLSSQNMENASAEKLVRPVIGDENCHSSVATQDLDLAVDSLEGDFYSEDNGSSSDESFDAEDGDETWSETDEKKKHNCLKSQISVFAKQSATNKACKVATRRPRASSQIVSIVTSDLLEDANVTEESAPTAIGTNCDRLREYNRNHPVIRCKQKPCSFRSRSINTYQVHLATMHASGAQLFPCPTCDKPFLDVALLDRHRRFKHRKPSTDMDCTEFHQCPHCEYKTRYKVRYEVHLNRRHGESNTTIFRCEKCSVVFLRLEAFERHKRSHKLYKCTHCEFETTKKWTYTNHLFSMHRVNEKGQPVEKPKCPECDYRGKNQCVLRYHIATRHTVDKPYKCSFPQCSYSSGRKGDRDKHYKIAHLGQRNYMCEFCSFRTITPFALELHRRTHTGERPFQCETCSKKFGDRYTLKKHTKLHTSNEKPFLCHLCTFACNRRDNLRTHLKGVHKNQIANMDISAVS